MTLDTESHWNMCIFVITAGKPILISEVINMSRWKCYGYFWNPRELEFRPWMIKFIFCDLCLIPLANLELLQL